MNASVHQHIYGYVEKSILFGERKVAGLEPCIIFGITSIPSRCLHFSIMLETGAQWARVPIHKLRWTHPANGHKPHPLGELQLWDCLGWDFEVVHYEYLREMSCEIIGPKNIPASYWFTIDHTDNGFSNYPVQHKCFHLLLLEDGSGQIAALPNNRILWLDRSFVERPKKMPPYETVGPTTWHAES